MKIWQNGHINISEPTLKPISISFCEYVPHAIPAMGCIY
jgi:hypothetical protein